MSSFILTKSHVLDVFAPLQNITDLETRSLFFTHSVVPDVIWTITGSAHSLAGTRYSIQEHSDASFNRLRKRLQGPIKFTVTRVIVDTERSEDGWWACVETRDGAMRQTGLLYNNE